MTISSAIANANSGLQAAQRRADVVSNNIANALTPGYARREISVSEQNVGGRGAGVSIDGVTRAGDQVLTRERRSAEGFAARDGAVAGAYGAMSRSLGGPEDPFSLFAQFQNLETMLRALGDSPESTPQQAQTFDAARALAVSMKRLAGEAQDARLTADGEIARAVAVVNENLKKIEKLNGDISAGATGGRDTSALQDQRKQLVDEVAKIIPVREVAGDRGKIGLITPEGVYLLADTAREVAFAPASGMTATAAYAGGAGVLSGLTVAGIDITPGGGGQSIRQGFLAGQFAIRDEVGPGLQTKLDALARDLIERFSGADPTLAPGAPGLFTDAGGAFDPLAEQGLASRLAVNAAADPDQGGALWRLRDGLGAAAPGTVGNATLVRALLDRFTEARAIPAGAGLGGALSATEAAAGLSSSIGGARISAEINLASSRARADAIADAETEATAVDTDAELQKLIIIEQAFAANARVIETAQAMIARLLEI